MATLDGQSQLPGLPQMLTVKQAAHILNIKERTLYALVDKKQIPFRRVGGALRFDCAELEAWTKGEKMQAKPDETTLRAIK